MAEGANCVLVEANLRQGSVGIPRGLYVLKEADWHLCEGTIGEGVIDTYVRSVVASIIQAAHRVALQEALGGAADALGVDATQLAADTARSVAEHATIMTQNLRAKMAEKYAPDDGVKRLAPRQPSKLGAKLRNRFPAYGPGEAGKKEAVNG